MSLSAMSRYLVRDGHGLDYIEAWCCFLTQANRIFA